MLLEPATRLHAEVGGLLPVVHVREDAPTNGNGAVVGNLVDALARVRRGGTIRIHPGTYIVQDLPLRQSVTIVGNGATRPVLDAAGAATVFMIHHAVAADIRLAGLAFRNAAGTVMEVHGDYGSVLIEESDFAATDGSGLEAWEAVGSGLTIRNNRFVGGHHALSINSVDGALVEGNTFTQQQFAAMSLSGPGAVRIVDNDFLDCGVDGCAASHHSRDIHFEGNRIQVTAPFPGNALSFGGTGPLGGGHVKILRNTILGPPVIGRDSPQSADLYHGINGGSWAEATVVGNTIRNFEIGIGMADMGLKTVHANIIDDVIQGLNIYDVDALVFTRNDVTNAAWPFAYFIDPADMSALDLTCNWWGSVDGPQNTSGDPAAYTPWATEPVAGRTGVDCP